MTSIGRRLFRVRCALMWRPAGQRPPLVSNARPAAVCLCRMLAWWCTTATTAAPCTPWKTRVSGWRRPPQPCQQWRQWVAAAAVPAMHSPPLQAHAHMHNTRFPTSPAPCPPTRLAPHTPAPTSTPPLPACCSRGGGPLPLGPPAAGRRRPSGLPARPVHQRHQRAHSRHRLRHGKSSRGGGQAGSSRRDGRQYSTATCFIWGARPFPFPCPPPSIA